ncbi:MAG: tRNA (guanosine(46)-N7)-methyltransferase TrmB, partial [Clostridiales bacterium]|nr:tRNA (guanosine(46)-N7)-methyltransferase TrmB [Clostridiales bacterium]
ERDEVCIIENINLGLFRISTWNYSERRNIFSLDFHDPIRYITYSQGGDFIIAAASEQPQVDFVGIEKTPTVLYAAAAKNQGRPFGPLGNLRFLPIDAGSLEDYFFPGQIARIYLNFSDPWPKRRHESRRLTAKEKLAMYGRLLEPEGQVYLKTDGEDFFAFSLQGFVSEGWSVGKVTTDLHRSGYEGNIPTEYERRFVSMGQRIYRFEAWRHE